MSIARKLFALLENLTVADVQAMPPAERQRFAQELCERRSKNPSLKQPNRSVAPE